MKKVPDYNTTAKNEKHGEARKAFAQRKQDQWDAVEERQKARAQRSPQEQLALLDERLGEGQGAAKERIHLLALCPA